MAPLRRILVTGATGNQGSGVVRHCLQHGHQVRALVRDPDSAAARKLRELGAELVRGDYNDASALAAAVEPVDAVFHTESQTGDWAGDLERTRNVIAAARAAPGVSAMIVSTAIKAGQHETFPGWGPDYAMRPFWLNKQAIEDAVRGAGFASWTLVRMGHFLQLFRFPQSALTFPGFVDDDTLRVAYRPTTRIPWVDGADVGLVVAAALDEPAKWAGREIDLAVEALTIEETAARLGKALGKEVKVHYYSEDEIADIAGRSPVPAAHRWANEVPGEDAVGAAGKEFTLTSVDSFFRDNVGSIQPS